MDEPYNFDTLVSDIDGVERKRRKQIFPVDGFANLDSIFGEDLSFLILLYPLYYCKFGRFGYGDYSSF